MIDVPQISVVMGVYNGAEALPDTIDSVLSQEDVSLELIIVDDGSTDDTAQLLQRYERLDSRIRIIQQKHGGLTKALVTGCAAARGAFIARQDVGDVSLPGRLKQQLGLAQSRTDVGFVSCGTRFVGPLRELLYDAVPLSPDQTAELLTLDLDRIKGPSMHGCTMFSRNKYIEVGGYRSAFYFAQDLDLWIRLAENGKHLAITEVLYQASLTLGSITSRYRKQQLETARLILESAHQRRSGKSDEDVLRRAAHVRPNKSSTSNRRIKADALYFIGACLRQQRNPSATHYFQRALLTNPFHLKSAVRLISAR